MNPSDPKSQRDRRREAILDVAREVFFEEGYTAASMSTIAARLGGSKGTLYNYFRGKEELFEAHVLDSCARFDERTFDILGDTGPIEGVLTRLSVGYLEKLYTDWAVRTYRLIIAEAQRTPRLARLFYEAGPAASLKRLEVYLASARDRGLIQVDDCALSAGDFFSLCRGDQHFVYVLNIQEAPDAAGILAQAERAVRLFLKSHAA